MISAENEFLNKTARVLVVIRKGMMSYYSNHAQNGLKQYIFTVQSLFLNGNFGSSQDLKPMII